MFSKYNFHKIISYFPCWKQDFENDQEDVFKIYNGFNGIAVNKMKTVDSIDLPKLFYITNWEASLYHKFEVYPYIKKRKKKKEGTLVLLPHFNFEAYN